MIHRDSNAEQRVSGRISRRVAGGWFIWLLRSVSCVFQQTS
jgi:hypothetical protein